MQLNINYCSFRRNSWSDIEISIFYNLMQSCSSVLVLRVCVGKDSSNYHIKFSLKNLNTKIAIAHFGNFKCTYTLQAIKMYLLSGFFA